MALQPRHRLFKSIVEPVNGILFHCRPGYQTPLFHNQFPQRLADGRIVGNLLGNNIIGALQSVRHSLHALFRVKIRLRRLHRVGAGALLGKQQRRQRFQSLFPGHSSPGAPLLLVGAVEILYLRQSRRGVDGRNQRLR